MISKHPPPPQSSRRWVVNLFTHEYLTLEYLPWSSYDMHMHADLLSSPWLFLHEEARGTPAIDTQVPEPFKWVQALTVWPLMLRQAWFWLCGWLSVKIHRPVYAENSNQLCFFASFIPSSVSPLSWLARQRMSNCKAACTYELRLSSTLPPH